MKSKNERLIEIYNKISEAYYKIREDMILRPEADYFCDKIPRGSKILDAGCGNGRDMMFFYKKGYNVTGIDYSDGQLDIARKRLVGTNTTVLKQNILSLSLDENFYDGIWCCAVLQHFTRNEIVRILQSFYSLLKNEGIAMVSFKKGIGAKYVIEQEFNGIKRFTTFFEENDIQYIIRETGFKIEKMYTYNERHRFSIVNRDLDFIVAFLRKKQPAMQYNPQNISV